MTALTLASPVRHHAHRRPSLGRQLQRAASVALGVLVVLLGILIAPLPGPMGVPVMVVGLVLILRASYAAKRWFLRAQRRHPKLLTPFRRLLRRNPPFAQVFWQQVLRVERLVTAKGNRGVARLRKKLKVRYRAAWSAA